MKTTQERQALHAVLMEHANLSRRDAALVMLGLASAGASHDAAMIAAKALTRYGSPPTVDDSAAECAACSDTTTTIGIAAALVG